MRKSLQLTPQALPELLLICHPGTLNFAELFERAKRLGIADHFFDLLESTGYPPLQAVPTPTLDRWHQFWGQLTEALTQ